MHVKAVLHSSGHLFIPTSQNGYAMHSRNWIEIDVYRKSSTKGRPLPKAKGQVTGRGEANAPYPNTGTFGSTEMDHPNDIDVLKTFDGGQTISFSYRFAHISRTLRALQSSTKTSLRIDDESLLSVQFPLPHPN
ncbi:hypothetical protein ARMGADRAFT_456963 [Armillaria gallica]|uniref:Uncharacterized protein n=1 Tax=Armillaria gallica TaxID=47427 RepID=A0A2H3D095_ARMGA|nr:hypothetical protein ARMGADRAFT_456963 [Armillaria gallica]